MNIFDINTSVEITYGQSVTGKMLWRHVSDVTTNESHDRSYDIDVYKWKLGLKFDWQSSFMLKGSIKGLLVRTKRHDSEEYYIVSLDAINSLTLIYIFK